MEYDVYDPSNSVSIGYWQVGTAAKSDDADRWQAVANAINQGLPARETTMFQKAHPEKDCTLWGFIDHEQKFWLYRMLLTGRDNHGRPGRYFFVLFRFAANECLDSSVIRPVIARFSRQTSIPLDIRINDIEADQIDGDDADLALILEKITGNVSGPNRVHCGWIVQGGKIIREHADLPIPKTFGNRSPIPPVYTRSPSKPDLFSDSSFGPINENGMSHMNRWMTVVVGLLFVLSLFLFWQQTNKKLNRFYEKINALERQIQNQSEQIAEIKKTLSAMETKTKMFESRKNNHEFEETRETSDDRRETPKNIEHP
jgi:hypothetical protein